MMTIISVEEFQWNLKRLILEGFPQGIPLEDLSTTYIHWFGKEVEPNSIITDSKNWEMVFRVNELLKKTFEITTDEIPLVKLRVDGNEGSLEELREVLELVKYANVEMMRAMQSYSLEEDFNSIPNEDSTKTTGIIRTVDTMQSSESVKVNCKMVNELDILGKDYIRFLDIIKEANADNTQCVWISNELIRSWKRQAKNEIESRGKRETTIVDADDDESLRNSDLQCDHGSLSPNVRRMLINTSAWAIIRKYFPTAVLWPYTVPECKTCTDASVLEQQNRTIAFNQRSQLADLYSNQNRPNPRESKGTYYLVPTEFIPAWRKFIRHPSKTPFPMIQIEVLLCQHELLMYPLHMALDLTEKGVLDESPITLLTEFEWNYLKNHLGVRTEFKILIDSELRISYLNGEPCAECSVHWWAKQLQKLYVYESGIIFIDKRDHIPSFHKMGK